MDLADLATALRRYADTEHGKRGPQHGQIVRELFRDPQGLADHISDTLRLAVKTVCRENPEEVRELLGHVLPINPS